METYAQQRARLEAARDATKAHCDARYAAGAVMIDSHSDPEFARLSLAECTYDPAVLPPIIPGDEGCGPSCGELTLFGPEKCEGCSEEHYFGHRLIEDGNTYGSVCHACSYTTPMATLPTDAPTVHPWRLEWTPTHGAPQEQVFPDVQACLDHIAMLHGRNAVPTPLDSYTVSVSSTYRPDGVVCPDAWRFVARWTKGSWDMDTPHGRVSMHTLHEQPLVRTALVPLHEAEVEDEAVDVLNAWTHQPRRALRRLLQLSRRSGQPPRSQMTVGRLTLAVSNDYDEWCQGGGDHTVTFQDDGDGNAVLARFNLASQAWGGASMHSFTNLEHGRETFDTVCRGLQVISDAGTSAAHIHDLLRTRGPLDVEHYYRGEDAYLCCGHLARTTFTETTVTARCVMGAPHERTFPLPART